MGMADVMLRFIAGRHTGAEFPIESDQELVIGRAEDADLRIEDDTISRKHAILSVKNGEIIIEDCSKNGTFVNGHAILSSHLANGDQIHIGRTIFKIIINRPEPTNWTDGAHRPARVAPAPSIASIAATQVLPFNARTRPAPSVASSRSSVAVAPDSPQPAPASAATTEHFRGSIAEIALTDLLQLFTTTRKTGTLVLRSRDMIGRIYFDHGRLRHVSMDDAETVNALKVLYRLMRWTDGTFEFEPPTDKLVPKTIDRSTDHLLLEAMQQLDEINNLGPQLPPLHAELALAEPLPAPMRTLAPGDLDFIQLALRYKTVRGILDHYAGTDFEGYIHLKGLLARRFLIVTES
jgi:hypothetical protein